MKKVRAAALLFAALFISIYGSFVSEAATKKSTDKYYELKNFKLTYDSKTGQVKALWNPTEKETDVVVTVYLNDEEIETDTVSTSSIDLTDLVRQRGVGTYQCEAYPVKLGESKTVSSSNLTITDEKLKKVREFDPSEYTIAEAVITYDEKTESVIASWSFTDRQSSAKVQLLKGTTKVEGWQSTTDLSIDLSDLIAKKGSGTYTVKVYPGRLGDNYIVESGEFEVTSAMVKAAKSRITAEEKAEEATRIGWYHDGPTNIWKYYKEPGVLMKKEWLDYNGARYHFSSSGIMQIGWQVIDDKYYYFDSTGALVTNATINSQYQVNAAGEFIDASGTVVSAAGEKEAPAIPTTLTACTISVSESGKEAGVVKEATFKAGTGFKIDSIAYSSEYPDWKAGNAVKVTVKVKAMTNYSFGNGIKFSVRGCKNVSSTGSTQVRTVVFYYYPKMQLKAPDFVYLNPSTELCWKKVPDAKRYKVVIATDGSTVLTAIVTTNKTSIADVVQLEDDAVTTTVKIYAMASEGKSSYFTTSQAFTIDNLYEYAQTNTAPGTLYWVSSGLYCRDENGDKVKGWQQMFGNWYYFKKTGYAAGPGWIKDETGLWYYFDEEYHMCTGKINDGTGEYFLNDGSVVNLPLGAWVEGQKTGE